MALRQTPNWLALFSGFELITEVTICHCRDHRGNSQKCPLFSISLSTTLTPPFNSVSPPPARGIRFLARARTGTEWVLLEGLLGSGAVFIGLLTHGLS